MSWLRRLAGLLAWAAGVAWSGAAEDAAPVERPWTEVRGETFAQVWQTVNEAYFDPKFGGVDWAAVREKYAARLDAVADKPALRVLLQQMLGELHSSHFAILPRDAAVFTPEERVRIGTIGAEAAWVDDAVVFTRVKPDSPAAKAGVTPGTAVRALDGRELAPLLAAWESSAGLEHLRAGRYLTHWVASRFSAPVGSKLAMRVEPVDGEAREIEIECAAHEGEWSEPVGNFPSFPIEVEVRHEPAGVTYLRFNVFARAVMSEVREGLLAVPAGDGLVLDLRGNPGGLLPMAAGLTGWLSDRQLWLGRMQMRQGLMQFAAFPQEGAFTGPVAVLVDGRSASTSELMAAGLQATGRARIFGERTAGQALPSSFKQLPTGDLFQFAMADMVTPRGKSLEGAGVIPDELVERRRADLAAGEDKVLAAALEWLQRQRAAPVSTSTGPKTTESK